MDFQSRTREVQYHTKYEVGANLISQYDANNIQTSIDKAVANGASGTTPAVIFIYAGTYNEILTLNEGISLIGKGGQVNIIGDINITGNASKPFNLEISNIEVTGVVSIDGSSTSTPARLFSKFSKFIGGINISAFTTAFRLEADSCVISRNGNKPIIENSNFGIYANHSEIIRTPLQAQDLLLFNKASKITNSSFVGGKVTGSGSEQLRISSTTFVSFNQECLEVANTNTSNEIFYSTLERRGTIGTAMIKSNTGILEVCGVTYRGVVVDFPLTITGGSVNVGGEIIPSTKVTTTNNTPTALQVISLNSNGVYIVEVEVTGYEAATGNSYTGKFFANIRMQSGTGTFITPFNNFAQIGVLGFNTGGGFGISGALSTNLLTINATGKNAATIEWTCKYLRK